LTKKNYTQFAKISDEYSGRGLRIVACPSNQFGGQEPGNHQDIVEFTKTIDPEMPEKLDFMEKANVNGSDARELFAFMKEELPNEDGTKGIRWNFSK
jgi:glutathione peroxidase